jgi:hypothetical protein
MKIGVRADSNWEAKVDHALRPLQTREEFEGRDYGAALRGLVIVINCRDPDLGHKERICLSRQKAELSMDIMLPLDVMARSTHAERRSLIAKSLGDEVARVVGKYRLESFDAERFLRDSRSSVERSILGPDAGRFDHLCAERAPQYATDPK